MKIVIVRYAIPRPTNFTLDLARPIEWIFTCPLIQLQVVLMGGPRIPSSRRYVMPGLTLLFLFCGLVSQLTPLPINYVLYIVGIIFQAVEFHFNRLQILEHSNGEEGLLSGESDFRRASLAVMIAWFPFPIFYLLTPEGFGILTNITVIQVGWAFLNIVAKFTFIFFIQRVKDNYCGRLKVKRELASVAMVTGANQMNQVVPTHGSQTPPIVDAQAKALGELNAIITETMTFVCRSTQSAFSDCCLMLRKVEEMMSKSLQATKRSQEANIEGNLQQRLEELVSAASERVRTSAETVAMWKTFTIRGRI